MKRILLVVATALVASPLFAIAETNVAVPPIRYGRIDTGEFPQPQLISDQPVTAPGGAGAGGPLYLHVPARHTKSWDKYCQRYEACGRPVYFVRDDWFKNVYTPRYNAAHPKSDAEGADHSDRPRDERGTDADREHDNLEHGVGDKGTGKSKGRS